MGALSYLKSAVIWVFVPFKSIRNQNELFCYPCFYYCLILLYFRQRKKRQTWYRMKRLPIWLIISSSISLPMMTSIAACLYVSWTNYRPHSVTNSVNLRMSRQRGAGQRLLVKKTATYCFCFHSIQLPPKGVKTHTHKTVMCVFCSYLSRSC